MARGQLAYFDGQRLRPIDGPVVVDPTNPGGGGTTPGEFVPPTPGTYIPGPTTTGLRPGWTTAKLTPYGGAAGTTTTITTDGLVIENRFITCRIDVRAKNVVIRNCEFAYGAFAKTGNAIIVCNNASVKNLLIQDCVIRVQSEFTWWALNAVFGRSYTVERCDVSNVTDGFGVATGGSDLTTAASEVIIRDNYVHDFTYVYWPQNYASYGNAGAAFTDYRSIPEEHSSDRHTHNDGVQVHWGTGTEIRRNNFVGFVNPNAGTVRYAADASAFCSGVPGMTQQQINDSFRQPYASTGGQITGQIILVQVAQGAGASADVLGNWIDGAAAGITFFDKGTATSAGSAVGNRFGRNIRSVGGVKTAIRFPAGQNPTLSDNTYADDGTPALVGSM